MDGELQEPLEPIGFLARSEARVATLETLQADGPLSRRVLNDRIPASRSTVTRTLSDFEDRDWVERTGATYRLTHVGEVLAANFLDLLESVRTTEELSEFLAAFPSAEHGLDIRDLHDADVTVATETEPFAPIREHAAALEDASTYRALLPAIVVKGKADIHERVRAGELAVEFVVGEAVADAMIDGEQASLFREQLELPNFDVFVGESVPPFFLSLIDEDIVQIGAMDEDGSPRAMLETTHPSIREWAEGLHGRTREASRVLTADAV